MGSTLIGFVESNISHSVSARRNNAAGVAAGNEKIRCRPSPSRLTLTLAGFASGLLSGGGAGAAGAAIGIFDGASAAAATGIFGSASAAAAGGIFGGASTAAAGNSLAGGAGICASGSAASFGA